MATKKNVKAANASRAKKMAEHKRQAKSRAEIEGALKSSYKAGDGAVILADLRAKIKTWQEANTKIAQDGVGARPTGFKLTDGSPEVENIYFTPEQRVTYLDRNHGMQSILDYIDRKLGLLPEPVGASAKIETEEKEEPTQTGDPAKAAE